MTRPAGRTGRGARRALARYAAVLLALAGFALGGMAATAASGPRASAAPTASGSIASEPTTSGPVSAGHGYTLTIAVDRLRSPRGMLLICVTANPRAFPDCRADASAHRLAVSASARTARVAGLAPGAYAVAIVHDENANGRLDTRLMIPREGIGFSRNPALRFGPPRFASARLTIAGDTAVPVRMRYFL